MVIVFDDHFVARGTLFGLDLMLAALKPLYFVQAI
jgi:hypothetical protein